MKIAIFQTKVYFMECEVLVVSTSMNIFIFLFQVAPLVNFFRYSLFLMALCLAF